MKFPKILVPLSGDGAGADKEAIELACWLAKEVKGKIYVVYAIQVKRSLPLDAELEPETEMAEKILSDAEEVAQARDCAVETDLLQTREIGPAIIDEAMERGVDLILMGTGYRKRFGQFDLGEVVRYVLRNAPCRVLLLRQPLVTDEKQ
ncbi:MAG: universal stress protein [Chloroflexi bacterium]|nr:MAG: universal stress protein [Chloroflexota bacterium]